MATRTSTSVSCSECGQPMDPTVAHDSDRARRMSPVRQHRYCDRDRHRRRGQHRVRDRDWNRTGRLRTRRGPAVDEADAECVRSSSRSRTMIATRFSTRSGGCTQCSSIYGRCGETLIDEHGIVARGVDDVIDTSPIAIALAHDLGNVAKHGSPLTRPPRSGYQPTFRLPQATRPGSGGPWMFRLDVGYDGTSVNGVDVARNAVDKWPEYLTGWGLV